MYNYLYWADRKTGIVYCECRHVHAVHIFAFFTPLKYMRGRTYTMRGHTYRPIQYIVDT